MKDKRMPCLDFDPNGLGQPNLVGDSIQPVAKWAHWPNLIESVKYARTEIEPNLF